MKVHSSVIHNGQKLKLPKCLDGWMDKIWHNHGMEYYSATQRNEVLRHTKTWADHEDITLSEISQ